MPENEGQWAYTVPDELPSTGQLLNQLYVHNQKQQVLNNLQQQRELQRQAQAAKFVGDNFKDANFATGTAADPNINAMTGQARAKFAKLIHENPNMDEGDLEMQMQGDLSKITQYANGIKAGRKSIEEGAAHYQQEPGLDSDALKQAAIKSMVDSATKNNGQIDPNKNYLNDVLQDHPELFVKGDQPLMASINAYKPKKGGATNTNENAGVTTENKFTDQVYPWQTVTKDAKGNPSGLQVNSVPATLSNGQALVDPQTHKPMQVVDDNTFQRVMTPGVAAQIKRDTDQYIKQNGYKPEDFTPGSEAYAILGKHILYNKLNELTPSEFVTDHKKTDASIVTKMQLGVVDALGRANSRAEQEKMDKLLNGNYGKIRQAVNLSPDAVTASIPYTDKNSGKQYMDVTNFVGGFKTQADKKGSTYEPGYQQVQKLLIDPSQPGKLYTVEGPDAKVQEYDENGINSLLMRHAPANGHTNLSDVRTINDNIPIKPNMQQARAARADMELKRRQQQATAANAILNPVEQ